MRRAWTIVGSAVTVVALVWMTLTAVSLLAREEEQVTATFDAAGLTGVRVRTDSGSIEVVATEEAAEAGEVRLVAELRHGLRRTSHRTEIRDGVLHVSADCPFLNQWCRASYRLEVPAHLAVEASAEDGRLVVTDVAGPVDVDGANGSVELTRLGGDVRASTDNGRVVGTGLASPAVDADSDNGRVSLTFAEPPQVVQATTSNGSVEVVVPDDATTYLVDIDTGNGSTDIGVRTDPASDRRIYARTHNGDVRVRYPTG